MTADRYSKGRTCSRCSRPIRDDNRTGLCQEHYQKSHKWRMGGIGLSTYEVYYFRERR